MTPLSKDYCAVRVGLQSLFERIDNADPILKPHIDASETIRIMLADYFYGDVLKPIGKKVVIGDRVIAFKDSAIMQELWSPQIDDVLMNIAEIFWELSDYIQTNVLKASETYTHTPAHCFYSYISDDKTIVVYLPVLAGLVQESPKFPCAAVVQGCFQTLPSFLKSVFQEILDKKPLSTSVVQVL